MQSPGKAANRNISRGKKAKGRHDEKTITGALQLVDTACIERRRLMASSPSLAHDELGNDVKVIAKRRREFEWAFSISA